MSIMPDIFSLVKENIDMESACQYHGVHLKKRGLWSWAICPLPGHVEKTASFGVRNNRWRCFGENIGGDVIDFYSSMFGLPPLEAAQRIAADFGLAVGSAQTQRPVINSRHLENMAMSKSLQRWRDSKHARLSMIYRVAHLAWKYGGPDAVPETVVHWLPQLPDVLDLLERGDEKEILMLWRKRDGWSFLAG